MMAMKPGGRGNRVGDGNEACGYSAASWAPDPQTQTSLTNEIKAAET